MARYRQAFEHSAVARFLPPESASVSEVSLQVYVAAVNLERWRSNALSKLSSRARLDSRRPV